MLPWGSHSETRRTVSQQAAVSGFVLLIAVVGLAALTAPAQASAHTGPAPANQSDGHGGAIGDTVEIEVNVPDGATGRYFLGSREVAYLTGVAFTDDGDGEVTLSVNTYLAGGHLGAERRAWSAESGRITNVTRYTEPLSDPLEPTVYDANLTVGGTERAVTPVPLRAASVRAVSVGTAPASAFGDEPADIASTPTDRIAVGDTLVTTVGVDGVFGLLASQPGETTTARFRSLLDSDNASFEIRPGTVDADLDLDRSFENDAFDVYADADAGNLTVVADTSALRYEGDVNELEAGEDYTVVFVIESESGLSIEEAARADDFRATDRTATFETGSNGTVQVPSVPRARLAGTTTVAPGTELVVEARAGGVFLRRNRTRVGTGGAFATLLNLSAVEPGTEFVARIDDLEVETPGVVIDATERTADTGQGVTPQQTEFGTPDVIPRDERKPLAERRSVADESVTSPTATTTANRPTNTTDESGPGLGIPAALVALLVVTGLALGRRRVA
ncbi:BGTF surface domain-containing protein [Halorientalis pallida]|uniref:BGTF surface domain-containing protein n=1 Tax=Halorientalis pallida TaxID=2479928 RepID=UPI003C6FDB2C